MEKKIKHVCTVCGSDDVVWDATSAWNVNGQEFELIDTMDQAYCNNCDGECNTKEVEVEEQPTREFVNGFPNWIETFFEIASHLTTTCDNAGSIAQSAREQHGQGGVWDAASNLTDEFENKYKGKEWDGEWFDTLDEFLKQKERVHLAEIHN